MELSQVKTVEQLAAMIRSLDMVTSVAWTDYSGDSTIVGFSGTIVKKIYYQKIFGKLIIVTYHIEGTGDGTSVSFTLPFASSGRNYHKCARTRDNDTWGTGLAYGYLATTASIVNFYKDETTGAAGSWTATNNRRIYGQFIYEAT